MGARVGEIRPRVWWREHVVAEARRRWRRIRWLSGPASLALVAGMVLVASPAQAQAPAGTPSAGAAVEEQVWAEIAAEKATTVWAYLSEQAELGAVRYRCRFHAPGDRGLVPGEPGQRAVRSQLQLA